MRPSTYRPSSREEVEHALYVRKDTDFITFFMVFAALVFNVITMALAIISIARTQTREDVLELIETAPDGLVLKSITVEDAFHADQNEVVFSRPVILGDVQGLTNTAGLQSQHRKQAAMIVVHGNVLMRSSDLIMSGGSTMSTSTNNLESALCTDKTSKLKLHIV